MSLRVEHIGDATLYLGDARDVLPTLGHFDAVITDPPYSINTKSDGNGKLSPWGDLCNSAFWYADWIATCRKLLKSPHGTGSSAFWTFLNWRSLVAFQKASCDIAWPIESLLVWDKCWIGPGGSRGLRPSYELIALFIAGKFTIADRGLPDIQRWRVGSYKQHGHPAEKPIEAARWLVKHSGGQSVLDPFMGSGTTGAAAIRFGRKFTGIEIEERWFDIACRRIEAEARQPRLELASALPKPQQLLLLTPDEDAADALASYNAAVMAIGEQVKAGAPVPAFMLSRKAQP